LNPIEGFETTSSLKRIDQVLNTIARSHLTWGASHSIPPVISPSQNRLPPYQNGLKLTSLLKGNFVLSLL
jgi:hypothetical protein